MRSAAGSVWLGLAVFGVGCGPGYSYVRTGPAYAAVPEDAEVKVLTARPAAPFEELGVVEVKGRDLGWRVERAKEAARHHGGNAIVLLQVSTDLQSTQSSESVSTKTESGETVTLSVPVTEVHTEYRQSFLILRMQAGP